jgi:transposase InsO family protein
VWISYAVKKVCPVKIEKILTDNGTQFTNRFTSKEKQPTGHHAFDQECAQQGIEHRLIPPRHPQTSGMGSVLMAISVSLYSKLVLLVRLNWKKPCMRI